MDTSPEKGDIVIVETERGSEIGEILEPPHDVAKSELVAPLKPVVRIADEADIEHAAELRRLEAEAKLEFRALVKKHGLDMKPIDVEYLFDGSKVVFYFSAEERVDFRELVRELAARFKARIDMRQVGVRDEARMVGGIGHCGQPLCCVRFPGDFQPVSIRMAKEQDLPLNPLKISGLCGRLMCCLRYEYDAYKDFKGRAPKRRAVIETPLGLAKVTDLNTPKETVTMRLEDGQRMTVPLCGMECGAEGGRPCSVRADALEESGIPIPVAAPVVEADEASKPRSQRRRRPAGSEGSSQSRGSRQGKSDDAKSAGDSGSKSEGKSEGKSGAKSGSRRGGKKSGRKKTGQATTDKPVQSDSAAGSGSTSGESTSSGTAGSGTGRRRRRRRTPRPDGAQQGENKES